MLRNLSIIAFVLLMCGCEREQSALEKRKLEEAQVRADEVELQRVEIESAIQSLNSTSLIPEDVDWTYRLQAQDFFSTLNGRNVHLEIEVRDIVKLEDGFVVSGEAPAFTYPLVVAVRLHDIGEDVARSIKPFGSVVCIGEHTVTAPTGPYLEARAINEYDVEIEYAVMPLIVDVDCLRAWSKD